MLAGIVQGGTTFVLASNPKTMYAASALIEGEPCAIVGTAMVIAWIGPFTLAMCCEEVTHQPWARRPGRSWTAAS